MIVDRIYYSAQFLKGYKTLVSKHMNKELNKLDKILASLEKMETSTQYRNHSVGKVYDVHISNDIVLLYRYKTDSKLLIVSLELNNIALNHKELNKKIQDADKITIAKNIEMKGDSMTGKEIIKAKESLSENKKHHKKKEESIMNSSDNVYQWYKRYFKDDYQLENIRKDITFKEVYDEWIADEDMNDLLTDWSQDDPWLDTVVLERIVKEAIYRHEQ